MIIEKNMSIALYPDESNVNTPYKVFVNGKQKTVYETLAGDFITIECENVAEVEIFAEYNDVAIKPTRAKKKFVKGNGKVSLKVVPSDYLSIEFDENLDRPLFIFCDKPFSKDDYKGYNIVELKKGVNDLGKYEIKSNTVLYIPENAILNGYVFAKDVENIKIVGHGIIDSTKLFSDFHILILFIVKQNPKNSTEQRFQFTMQEMERLKIYYTMIFILKKAKKMFFIFLI